MKSTTKPFTIQFKLEPDLLAMLYICYRYKYPLSFLLSFYEMYGKQSLFVFKAMSCTKRMSLNDNTFIKIITESRILYKEILKGITTNIKRTTLINQVKNGRLIQEMIPDCPVIDLDLFSEEYKQFIGQYLLVNVENIFDECITLQLDTIDLYEEMSK